MTDVVHRLRRSECRRFPVSSTSDICWDRLSTSNLGCREVGCPLMAIHRAIASLVDHDGIVSSPASKRVSEVHGRPEIRYQLGSPKHTRATLGCREVGCHHDGHTSGSASPCLILRNYASIAPCPDVLPEFRRFPGPHELDIGWDRPSTSDLGCREIRCPADGHTSGDSFTNVTLYGSCSSTAPKRMSEVPGLLDLRHLLGSPSKHIQLRLSGGFVGRLFALMMAIHRSLHHRV
jgi:hypothetical protein